MNDISRDVEVLAKSIAIFYNNNNMVYDSDGNQVHPFPDLDDIDWDDPDLDPETVAINMRPFNPEYGWHNYVAMAEIVAEAMATEYGYTITSDN